MWLIERFQTRSCFIFQVVQNVIETFYGVTTWGKQAKTIERKNRKPLMGI